MLVEKDIERKAVLAANKLGWLSYKFASPAHRGVPDRLFIKDGQVVFIEFKTPRGRVTKLQERELAKLREAGIVAEVARSVEEALAVLTHDRLVG